ncbi:hypothetical protein [Azospirillum sp. SYSU D00513]|uniref:hypothetical protein n=1 Tax=Azospirillum sp. SYSU D00513 TaxID=2812561 RepID=UPI001A959755|nr:hypothetical protein [Azospirillum sp. SYSU D00513]
MQAAMCAATGWGAGPAAGRLVEAWREAADAVRLWRDDPAQAEALRAARRRLRRPEAPPPRKPEDILKQELAAARAALERARGDVGAECAAFALVKRWEPGLFGYGETQRSIAGKIAAMEAMTAQQDAQERAEALALLRRFRAVQERARRAARAVCADPQARLLAARNGAPVPPMPSPARHP